MRNSLILLRHPGEQPLDFTASQTSIEVTDLGPVRVRGFPPSSFIIMNVTNANEEHEYPICKHCRDLMPKDWEWQECAKCMDSLKPET